MKGVSPSPGFRFGIGLKRFSAPAPDGILNRIEQVVSGIPAGAPAQGIVYPLPPPLAYLVLHVGRHLNGTSATSTKNVFQDIANIRLAALLWRRHARPTPGAAAQNILENIAKTARGHLAWLGLGLAASPTAKNVTQNISEAAPAR